MEAWLGGRSAGPHPDPSHRYRGRPVCFAVLHYAAAAALVRARRGQPIALALVCVVEFRIVFGPAGVSFRIRAILAIAHTRMDLVRGLRFVRDRLRMDCLARARLHSARRPGQRSSRVGPAQPFDRAVLARTFRLWIHRAGGHDKSDFRRHRSEPVSLGRRACDLLAYFRAGIREQPVLPEDIFRCRRRSCSPGGLHVASRVDWSFAAVATRALSRGGVHRLHALPWRTRALASVAALSYAILFDDRRRRRFGRRFCSAGGPTKFYRIPRTPDRSRRRDVCWASPDGCVPERFPNGPAAIWLCECH